jgi:DNA modification methylase
MNTIEFGDCRDIMKRWVSEGVKIQTCITSPPYFGLRDYGHEGQIGLEQNVDEYVQSLVGVFSCVWDLLNDDGTLWLNLGDSYAGSGKGPSKSLNGEQHRLEDKHSKIVPDGLKPKDLIGVPWRVAFALQSFGWYLRQDMHQKNYKL